MNPGAFYPYPFLSFSHPGERCTRPISSAHYRSNRSSGSISGLLVFHEYEKANEAIREQGHQQLARSCLCLFSLYIYITHTHVHAHRVDYTFLGQCFTIRGPFTRMDFLASLFFFTFMRTFVCVLKCVPPQYILISRVPAERNDFIIARVAMLLL